jgi:hypothetical protein
MDTYALSVAEDNEREMFPKLTFPPPWRPAEDDQVDLKRILTQSVPFSRGIPKTRISFRLRV